jgi:hypothetical protein
VDSRADMDVAKNRKSLASTGNRTPTPRWSSRVNKPTEISWFPTVAYSRLSMLTLQNTRIAYFRSTILTKKKLSLAGSLNRGAVSYDTL